MCTPIDFEIMYSNRGRELLVINGYKLCFHKILNNDVKRYKCCKCTCNAFVKLSSDEQSIIEHDLIHNHDPMTEAEYNKQKLRNSVKLKAIEDTSSRPSQLVREELGSVNLPTITLHDVRLACRSIRKARKSKARGLLARKDAKSESANSDDNSDVEIKQELNDEQQSATKERCLTKFDAVEVSELESTSDSTVDQMNNGIEQESSAKKRLSMTSSVRKPSELDSVHNNSDSEIEQVKNNERIEQQSTPKKRRLTAQDSSSIVWSTKRPKVKSQAPSKPKLKCTPKTPLEAWSLLFPDEALNTIVDQINAHIKRTNGATFPDHHRETDLTELKATIGLFYFVALYKVNNFDLKSLWEPHAPSRFRLTMTLKRFQFLLNSFNFNDEATWDTFVSNCRKYHHVTHSEYTISERSFDTLKVVTLIDASIGYMVNAIPCWHTDEVDIRKLTEPIHNASATVTCESKFTSIEIFDEMKNECGLCMVGEMDESEVPDEFKVKGDVKFGYHEDKTLISYNSEGDDKVLVLMSTRDDSDEIDEQSNKPEVALLYEKTREASKNFDAKCFEYSTTRKTITNTTLRLLYAMLDLANYNSFILYSQLASNKLKKPYEFMTELVLSLTHEQMRKRQYHRGLNLCLRLQIQEYLKPHEYSPDHDPKDEILDSKMDQRKLCGYCPDNLNHKSWYQCLKCKRPMCYEHQCKLCEACGELYDKDI